MKKLFLSLSLLSIVIIILSILFTKNIFEHTNYNIDTKESLNGIALPSHQKAEKTIKISAIGDCALGQDSRFLYKDSFDFVADKLNKAYKYFFSKVVGILSRDDLTIANLETSLTNETEKAEKYDYGNNYWFKGRTES